MPRTARIAPGGFIYHVLNRGVGRMTLFRTDRDYAAFHRALIDTLQIVPMRVLFFCIMPNHWHLVLWPNNDGELARFMLRLTITHVRRWVEYRKLTGTGHVYQGRYKSFAVQCDEHLLTLARYVERNPLRAKLVKRAQDWKYSSLGQAALEPKLRLPLTESPVDLPKGWLDFVNQPQTAAEEATVRRSVLQNRPLGSEKWIKQSLGQLGWREPLPRGRPRKSKKKSRR
jgi:putative transposase